MRVLLTSKKGNWRAGVPSVDRSKQFRKAGGDGKDCYAEMTVCWAEDKKQALHTAFECWPNLAITGELAQLLPVPAHFEQAARRVREEDLAEDLVCGNNAGDQHPKIAQVRRGRIYPRLYPSNRP